MQTIDEFLIHVFIAFIFLIIGIVIGYNLKEEEELR